MLSCWIAAVSVEDQPRSMAYGARASARFGVRLLGELELFNTLELLSIEAA